LIEEMKENIDIGNSAEANSITNEIKENNLKIIHHGRRAEAIVKSMLQHSRVSTGEKQATDINALAEEYLRLSYQAMRSKNKDFQAIMETHFDDTLPKVDIVSQDIGRVLLNLFQNAFYAVNKKGEQLNGTFEPMISVSTKKQNGKVEIIVKDNGTGIPQKAVDKIFQPFFTTKPTGEGTGLGLSLSYDIISKGHGGELNVNSKEGEFTEFLVRLPL
jgi:two-component system, NtrC family, sensor kinase